MKRIIYFIGVVLCLCSNQIKAQTVDINFAQKKGICYPEVFGVVIKSPTAQVASFDMLQQYGVKMIRATAPMNLILPESITLSDYKNNVNDVQDPDNWPGWGINSAGNGDFSWAIQPAKQRGLKTLLSICYYPSWLSWGSGGDKPFHRVPLDWEVNSDIFKKTFNRFKDYTDMVGISNEPNFMEIDGSPYTTGPAAYKDMYKNSSAAIREISPEVKIVGPEIAYNYLGSGGVEAHPENLAFVSALVNASDIPDSNLNAITFHHYFEGVNIHMLDTITNLPVYVSEWNSSSGVGSNTPANFSGKESLAWVGDNLIHLLDQGARGSTLFMHYPQPLTSPKFGTYEWDATNGVAIPHLNMRSFALLSVALKLGEGIAETKKVTFTNLTNAMGALNSNGDYVAAVSNVSSTQKSVNVNFNHLPFSGRVQVSIFEASENQEAFTPVITRTDTVVNGKISFSVEMPSQSLKGILLTPTDSVTANLSIVSPDNGAVFPDSSDIEITTNAAQLNTAIQKVEFFSDSTKLGESTVAPFSFNWLNVPIGTYNLTIKSTDSNVNVLNSTPVQISVTAPNPVVPASIIGSWTTGNSHAPASGTDRLLVLTAHVEHGSAISLDSVYYGGKAMTKVIDLGFGAGYKSYVASFYLKEADIVNAVGNAFSFSWSATPRNTPTYSSVFLSGVDQDNPIGDNQSMGFTGESLATAALTNNDGDMALLAATTGESGTYATNNGFTKALELSVASADGVVGYLATNGTDVTPQVTHTISTRQALIGFIVKHAALQTQSILFNSIPNKTYGDPDFALSARSNSGLPLKFKILSGPAILKNDNTVHITGTGKVIISAINQGNASYKAAHVNQTFVIKDLIEVVVYPNPTKGKFKIVIGNRKKDKAYTLKLYNPKGVVIQSAVIPENQNFLETEFDVINQNNGFYYLHVSDGSKNLIRTIIKI